MSNQITVAHVNTYVSTVSILSQQMGSKMRKAVTVKQASGNRFKIDEQINAVEAENRTTRHDAKPIIETPHAARWADPIDKDWGDVIDKQDKVRILIDPESSYAKNGVMAVGRAMDDEIIRGAIGTNFTGETGTGTATFDTTNMEVAAGAAGMTVQKLSEARRRLQDQNVDIDNDELWCMLAPEQAEDLFSITNVTSSDFVNNKILVSGRLGAFNGFNFIITTKLPVDGSSARRCLYWAKSGVALGIWTDITGTAQIRPDLKRDPLHVTTYATFGATRLEEVKVGHILCVED